MATFTHINADHVFKALKTMDSLAEGELKESTGYDLLYEAKRYPPKEVLRLADTIAGKKNHNDFSGGKTTNDPLIRLGFNIVLKDTNQSIPLGYSQNNISNDFLKVDSKNTVIPTRKAYLLTWNPDNLDWSDIDTCIDKLNYTDKFITRWSCGNTKKIEIGDRIFIIKLGKEPKGIFASGKVAKECYKDLHWDKQRAEQGDIANYIDVDFDVILNYVREPILPKELLATETLSKFNWSRMASGITIPNEVLFDLEELWYNFLKKNGKIKIVLQQDTVNEMEDMAKAVDSMPLAATEKEQLIKARIGQGKFKRDLLKLTDKCCLCSISDQRFLIASHIKPWSRCESPEERIDPYNGFLLCPNHDALFDKGLVSFKNSGEIML